MTLQVIKHYGKAVRTKSLKGFCLNLPLCQFVKMKDQNWVEVDKEFYLAKKRQAEKDYKHYCFKRNTEPRSRSDHAPMDIMGMYKELKKSKRGIR